MLLVAIVAMPFVTSSDALVDSSFLFLVAMTLSLVPQDAFNPKRQKDKAHINRFGVLEKP